MRLVQGSLQVYRSRPHRQDVLSFRHGLPRVSGICRECRKDLPSVRMTRRPQATLCPDCINERLERLSADAL